MHSPEAPMASSKIHSRGASMSGRKNTLPIYGDFSKTRENYRKQTTAYPGQVLLISPAPPAAERGTHKVVAVSAPLAKVIQARQADRHCEKSPDERGLRVGSPVWASRSLWCQRRQKRSLTSLVMSWPARISWSAWLRTFTSSISPAI